MRALMIPLLMAALPATAAKPEKLIVVVHTADRVVIDYTCSNFLATDDPT